MAKTVAYKSIIARCYDNHSALLMHITSSGLGYSTQPPFRHGDHDHHDETEAGLDFYTETIASPWASADLQPTFASGLYFQTKPSTCGLVPIALLAATVQRISG